MTAPDAAAPRPPLTRARVLEAAIALVDRGGLGALTMRRLGAALGVEAMSIYAHVANKEALLEAMVDRVIGAIELPTEGAPWRDAMARRAASARTVFGRHAWVIGLLEAGVAQGPNALRYLDAVIGSLRGAGFSLDEAARAFMLLDSYVYGHAIQERHLGLGVAGRASVPGEQEAASAFPHLAAMVAHAEAVEQSFDDHFAYGLELLLDGLEHRRSG